MRFLKMRKMEDRFYQYVSFGTGGMRGLIGAGTNRINIYTIRRVSDGLARYIESKGNEAKKRGVVIAYDTRLFQKNLPSKQLVYWAPMG